MSSFVLLDSFHVVLSASRVDAYGQEIGGKEGREPKLEGCYYTLSLVILLDCDW